MTQERSEAAAAKKERVQAEARQAWAEHEARKVAVEANTARLRALRLARESEPSVPGRKASRAKA
jgi:hypothetical protein